MPDDKTIRQQLDDSFSCRFIHNDDTKCSPNYEVLSLIASYKVFLEKKKNSYGTTQVIDHIHTKLSNITQEENNLMLHLFLNLLTEEEKESFKTSFKTSFPDIETGTQQGETYLKDISKSSLAEPQIYKGWGFRFEKPELFIEGEKHFIKIKVAEVFEGSRLEELGVEVGDTIRVEISKEQATNIDPNNIGQVAALIRSANSISVVKEGTEGTQEINKEMKGVFALGKNGKHTSFEYLPEEQIAKCFTEAKKQLAEKKAEDTPTTPTATTTPTTATATHAPPPGAGVGDLGDVPNPPGSCIVKINATEGGHITETWQFNKDALKKFAKKIIDGGALNNIETQLKTFYGESQNERIKEIQDNLRSTDKIKKEQARQDLFSLIEKTASHDGNHQKGFIFENEELYQAYLAVKQTAHATATKDGATLLLTGAWADFHEDIKPLKKEDRQTILERRKANYITALETASKISGLDDKTEKLFNEALKIAKNIDCSKTTDDDIKNLIPNAFKKAESSLADGIFTTLRDDEVKQKFVVAVNLASIAFTLSKLREEDVLNVALPNLFLPEENRSTYQEEIKKEVIKLAKKLGKNIISGTLYKKDDEGVKEIQLEGFVVKIGINEDGRSYKDLEEAIKDLQKNTDLLLKHGLNLIQPINPAIFPMDNPKAIVTNGGTFRPGDSNPLEETMRWLFRYPRKLLEMATRRVTIEHHGPSAVPSTSPQPEGTVIPQSSVVAI